MNTWNTIPSDTIIEKTARALEKNNFAVTIIANKQQAKEKALSLIPTGVEVMDMTSITLDTLGITKEIHDSGKYIAIKKKLMAMDRKTQGREMQKLGATPEYAIGSVHAITQNGHALMASKTGSQLPAYVYGSSHVIWVVGAQKIVKNIDEGIKRVFEYSLPLEIERAQKAYGIESEVAKLLIFYKEIMPERIHIILVKESLGF